MRSRAGLAQTHHHPEGPARVDAHGLVWGCEVLGNYYLRFRKLHPGCVFLMRLMTSSFTIHNRTSSFVFHILRQESSGRRRGNFGCVSPAVCLGKSRAAEPFFLTCFRMSKPGTLDDVIVSPSRVTLTATGIFSIMRFSKASCNPTPGPKL